MTGYRTYPALEYFSKEFRKLAVCPGCGSVNTYASPQPPHDLVIKMQCLDCLKLWVLYAGEIGPYWKASFKCHDVRDWFGE